MSKTKHQPSNQQRIVIPSGRPPVLLPYGVEVEEDPSTPEQPSSSEFGDGLLDGDSGLLTGSSALENALSDTDAPEPAPSKGVKRSGMRPLGGPMPSDEQILQWITDVRAKYTGGGFLSADALRYWVRYSFDALSPEYKAVGARIMILTGGK